MTHKQKIAIFLPTLHGGGAERAMILFARTVQELGYPVQLICAEKKGALVPLIDNRMPIIDLAAPRMLKAIRKLRAVLRQERPDVVYTTIVHANLALVLATRGLKVKPKIILRESNSPVSETKRTISRKISHFLVPYLYPRADKIIAVSSVVRDQLISISKSLADKVELLETPVIPASFVTHAAEEPGHPWFAAGEPPVVLGVGRLHPQKNFALLIRAFAKVRAERECRLIILGQGPLQAELQELVNSLAISKDVSFAGFSLNPFSFMSRARVFVLSSDYEGMPNVLIQALALATPVVATNCPGGCAECLEDGKLGALVPVGDVEAMRSAILQALDSPKREDSAEIATRRYGAEATTLAYLRCAGIPSERVS